MTRHVHAFGDDALGDHDAVGLVDALRAGRVSAAELVEAAIARTEAVNPTLNGLAYEAFDRARQRAHAPVPTAATSTVSRRSSRTTSTSRACRPCRAPTRGTRGRCPPTARSRGCSWPPGLIPLGKTQMSEFGFSASAEHPRIGAGAQPVEPGLHRGCILIGFRRVRRRGCRADRARQRRRRIDPDSGRRATDWSD